MRSNSTHCPVIRLATQIATIIISALSCVGIDGLDVVSFLQSQGATGQQPPRTESPGDLFLSRLNAEEHDVDRLPTSDEQKHADLLEKVFKFGLNQSQYLIEVQVIRNRIQKQG